MSPLQESLMWRYATKKFNQEAIIPDEKWGDLELALRFAPSSLGLQLWHFIVVQNPELREQLCEASYGQAQVKDCSHYLVLCGRRDVDQQDLEDYVAQMRETRGLNEEQAQAALNKYQSFSVFWKDEATSKAYIESQIHLAAGFIAQAAASMKIDSCMIGGMSPEAYDKVLGLESTRYRAVLGMAFGYRAEDDAHAKDQKVRFPADKLIEHR